VEILCDHPAVHATVSRFGPGRDGADLHIHRRHHDVFYVLEGELTLRLDDKEVAAAAGTLVCVPPLVVHGFKNASQADMRYLNLHAPGTGFADYMRGLRDGVKVVYDQEDPPAEGGADNVAVVIAKPPLAIDGVTVEESTEARGGTSSRLQAVFVLDGELSILIGETEIEAAAGAWVELPPHIPHTVSSHQPARYLIIAA
jgi:quercetin dioxygenase-like cupin family protein